MNAIMKKNGVARIVIDQRLVVVVIAIGKRDHDEAYQIAIKRK